VSAERLELLVNGAIQYVTADMLDRVLDELGYGEAKVATALNGDFISAARRAMTPVAAGDRIEIVAARQGG
jgi:sulfur carrier protein